MANADASLRSFGHFLVVDDNSQRNTGQMQIVEQAENLIAGRAVQVASWLIRK